MPSPLTKAKAYLQILSIMFFRIAKALFGLLQMKACVGMMDLSLKYTPIPNKHQSPEAEYRKIPMEEYGTRILTAISTMLKTIH